MATYQDIYNYRKGEGGAALRNRTEVALVDAAMSYLRGTPPLDPDIAALCKSIASDSTPYTEKIIWAVFTDPVILSKGDAATDAELKTAATNAVLIFLDAGA